MDIKLLAKCGKMNTYPRGRVICREGQAGNCMYIILKGRVTVTINSASEHPEIVDVLNAGSFFGEMALLEGKPRTATVSAEMEDVIALEVDKDSFPELLKNAPQIAYKIMAGLNDRLNHMIAEIERMDTRFALCYRENEVYKTIQKLDEASFGAVIVTKGNAYVWELLKYISSSLDMLNKHYLELTKQIKRPTYRG